MCITRVSILIFCKQIVGNKTKSVQNTYKTTHMCPCIYEKISNFYKKTGGIFKRVFYV
jgi:hypothetical protein